LFSADEREFYGSARRPLYYAQARYVCLYLQERGVLEEAYRRRGERAMWRATGAGTVAEFERAWLAWIDGIEAPGD
jgi:hypothetical protein